MLAAMECTDDSIALILTLVVRVINAACAQHGASLAPFAADGPCSHETSGMAFDSLVDAFTFMTRSDCCIDDADHVRCSMRRTLMRHRVSTDCKALCSHAWWD